MVWQLLCYLYLTLLCGAAGLLVFRIALGKANFRSLYWADLTDGVLILGLVAFGTLLLIWSLFLPLGGRLPHLLGLGVILWGLRVLWAERAVWRLSPNARWVLVLVGIFPWFAASFAGGLAIPAHYDTFLYHAQTIMWNEQFPVVPGLGNLHGRFAFNSSYLLLAAYFGLKPWAGITLFPLNSFIMLVTTFGAAGRAVRGCLRGEYPKAVLEAVMLAFLYGLELFGGRENTSSPSPDILAGVLVYYGCQFALKVEDARWREFAVLATSWICAFAVTVKLSALPLFGLPLLVFLRNGWPFVKKWILLAGVMAVVLLPWVVRNEVLSGYLVYPIKVTGWFSPDWKMPAKAVALERVGIMEQALVSEKLASNIEEASRLHIWNWFPQWIRHLPPLRATLVLYVLMAPLFILPSMWWRRDSREVGAMALLLWAGALFSLSSAPNTTLRFAFGFLITCAALTTCCVTLSLANRWRRWVGWMACVGIVCWAWLGPEQGGTLLEVCGEEMAENPWMPDAELPRLQTKQMPCQNFHVRIPDPAPGSGHAPDWCGQEPLPCAPYYAPRLEMRGASLRDGFRIRPESGETSSKR